jgi:hypothetical protein
VTGLILGCLSREARQALEADSKLAIGFGRP